MSSLDSAGLTLLAVVLWGALHSLLAGPSAKRWLRHPLYTSGLALIWLSPAMTTGTLALFLGFTLYIIIGSQFEERQLAAEFGEPYLEYRRKVPALIPRPWSRG